VKSDLLGATTAVNYSIGQIDLAISSRRKSLQLTLDFLLTSLRRWTENMNLDAESYRHRLRDSAIENELAVTLRTMDKCDAFRFVTDLIGVNFHAGLDLARRVIRDRNQLQLLLDRGLREGNASSIKYWLQCVEQQLGTRRLIEILHSKIDEFPEGVSRAVYFVRQLVKPEDLQSKERLVLLEQSMQGRGLMRGPIVVIKDGMRLLAPIELPKGFDAELFQSKRDDLEKHPDDEQE